MKSKTTTTEPAADAGTTPATAVQWRCKVTKAGAGKTYGTNKHKRGVGALVILSEVEAAAAEGLKWVTREGVFTAPAAGAAPATTEA